MIPVSQGGKALLYRLKPTEGEVRHSFITLNSLSQCSLLNLENLKISKVKLLLITAVGDRDKRNIYTLQER